MSITVKDTGEVRWIYFNRPEHLNALTQEDIIEARQAVQDAHDFAKAIVFRGTGERSFSTGVHIDAFLELNEEKARSLINDLKALLESVRLAPIPTICAINGYCLGGAMELAMTCDLRIATRHAQFGMPEIKVGIPSVLDAALLQQHVGLSKAKEMLLTGDLYEAPEMERFGFLNIVVEQDELEERVNLILEHLKEHSKIAIAAQKRLFETWQNTGLRESIDVSVEEFARIFETDETHDRVRNYRRTVMKDSRKS